MPADLPDPDDPTLGDASWSRLLLRRPTTLPGGRYGNWVRIDDDLGDDPATHYCAQMFMSDAAPFRAGRSAHPDFCDGEEDREQFVGASLDHSVWFHRFTRADEWHWFDMRSHGLSSGRGLATGDVVTASGVHASTVAQQILLRKRRSAH